MPVLNVAAHQDDDLYFMSPDVLHDVASGDARGTIYLTAGDAGGGWGTYAQGRESGAKAAWAQMMGIGSPVWTTSTVTLAGKTVATSTLGGTSIRLVFLRLLDGNYGGGSDPHYLEGLYTGRLTSLTACDGSGDSDDGIPTDFVIVTKVQPRIRLRDTPETVSLFGHWLLPV